MPSPPAADILLKTDEIPIISHDQWHGRRMTPEPDPTIRSRRCTGVVPVPLPASEAIKLFSPEGERLWAGRDGWAPTYPDPTRTEGAGTVFETRHGHRHMTWVITLQTLDQVSYARVSSADGFPFTRSYSPYSLGCSGLTRRRVLATAL